MRANNPDESVESHTANSDRDTTASELAEFERRLERLQARNEQLEKETDRFSRYRPRFIALGFVGVGLLSFLAALSVPEGQTVLFTIAGIGLFAGVLTRTVAHGHFVESQDAERVYGACAANYSAIVADRADSTSRRYLPDAQNRIRLLVPDDSTDVPKTLDQSTTIGKTQQGVVLEPIGNPFVREVKREAATDLTSVVATVEQLADALEDRFEFVASADPVVDMDAGRVSVAISGSAFGAVDRFDHPVASILAVGLANQLEQPVRLEVTDDTDRGEWLVRCEWDR